MYIDRGVWLWGDDRVVGVPWQALRMRYVGIVYIFGCCLLCRVSNIKNHGIHTEERAYYLRYLTLNEAHKLILSKREHTHLSWPFFVRGA